MGPRSNVKPNTSPQRRLIVILLVVLIVGLVSFILVRKQADHPETASQSKTLNTKLASPPANQPPPFNKRLYSTEDPQSIWVVVNKRHPLTPRTYEPVVTTPNIPLRLGTEATEMHVSTVVAGPLKQLSDAAAAANVPLMLASGHRSYQLQVSVYNAEVKANGQSGADRESARPGYSEHQTGLAADLEPTSRQCEIAACFGQLPAGKWLAANAATYGFIIRYPENKESTTGYVYEPWHVRYVGVELARELSNNHTDTLETFFNLGPATSY